jgi:hypothetical protein
MPDSVGVAADRALLWDYVPWEQMCAPPMALPSTCVPHLTEPLRLHRSKQRRGIMWSLQQAHELDRTLVIPPFRFHAAARSPTKAPDDPSHEYEYRAYSDLFDLAPLRRLHPAVDLQDYLNVTARPQIDLVFSLLRGAPRRDSNSQHTPDLGADDRAWVQGECQPSNRGNRGCTVGPSGDEVCTTSIAFAGAAGGVHVGNLTCGWAPSIRWDRTLRLPDVRRLPSVGLQGIVYQIPPVKTMAELYSLRAQLAHGEKTCGWRCAYASIRTAMAYQPRFVRLAERFLDSLHGEGSLAAAPSEAQHWSSDGGVYVIAVHWRRGDFLTRGGMNEQECIDLATGAHLLSCAARKVLLTPAELASSLQVEAASARVVHGKAPVVFLASNAAPKEVDMLRARLVGTSLVRFDPSTPAIAAAIKDVVGVHSLGAPELAVMDTLVCALADSFVGTRRSLFSWNILEERVLQGRLATSARLM